MCNYFKDLLRTFYILSHSTLLDLHFGRLLPLKMAVFGLFCESYDMSFISMDDVSYVFFLWRAGLLDMYFNQNEYVDN